MPAALQLNTLTKDKVNLRPVGNRVNEATAEDFDDIGLAIEDHAVKIDALTGAATPNPNYGTYTSLALLQAAHTVGVAGAYAIIDQGVGFTPQIAIWDVNDTAWKINAAEESIIFVLNFVNLPAPGVENKIYITTSDFKSYVWKNAQYNLISQSIANDIRVKKFIDGFWVDTFGNVNTAVIEVGNIVTKETATRLFVGRVNTLPATDENNLSILLDNEI